MGPRAGLYGCGKSGRYRDSIRRPSSLLQIAILAHKVRMNGCLILNGYRNCAFKFDVCVTVHLCYNSVNNQLDATITIY